MKNIKGAFVVLHTTGPVALLMSERATALFADRISAVGYDKAIAYTFGHTATNALPCTEDCMTFIALEYQGAHSEAVRQLCARIALGQPIGSGKDITEGGQPAIIDAPKDKPLAPVGQRAVA